MTSSARHASDQQDWSDRLMTVDEFQYANPLPHARTELVEGRMIVREPPFWAHGQATAELLHALMTYVDAHLVEGNRIGLFSSNDPGMLLGRNPGTVRAPDIAYFLASRIPENRNHWFEVSPDMVTETRSPSDRPGYLRRKIDDWQRAGCRNVWIVDPGQRTFTVMHGDETTTLQVGEVFDGGQLFPGLEMPIATLFR